MHPLLPHEMFLPNKEANKRKIIEAHVSEYKLVLLKME